MSLSKKEKKETGELLGELFCDGGHELLMEHYHNSSECLDEPVAAELRENTVIGEEIEEFMAIYLAKKFAKLAGGKFIPHGGIK